MTELTNLLLNMSSGLLPEHLKEREISLLEKEYGKNWFEELGYNKKLYRNPNSRWTKLLKFIDPNKNRQ